MKISVSVADMLVLKYRYRQKYLLGEYIGIRWIHTVKNNFWETNPALVQISHYASIDKLSIAVYKSINQSIKVYSMKYHSHADSL